MRIGSKFKSLFFEVNAKWLNDKEGFFIAKDSTNEIYFSCPSELGGIDTPSPEDLFLASIATCTLTTLIHICDSLHSVPKQLEVKVGAKMILNNTNEYNFSTIDCKILVKGDTFLLKRACELIPKYCLINKSIKPKINYLFDIQAEE